MPNKAQDDDLVMSLVELALARAPEERERYLHSACAHDSQLLEEVRKYVDAEERMNGFLLEPLYPPLSFKFTLEPGELLDGRFRIVREVAQGGMGIVYEALDERLERRIAIKCAKPGFRKRLPPEVRHATEISHPNVCKIFEIHTASTDRGEIDFITMEFLEGETLTERLRRGPLPEAQARAIAQQLCAGLAAAHRNQVIHGDLKSNNVILTTAADGAIRAVITDFGLARRPETTQQTVRSGALGGTPDYMAPELWKGEKATAASDIYALGVILYELASGRAPFRSPPEGSWEERLNARPPAVNPKWDRVLARCLEADPARRFRSAQEVGQALAPRSRRWMLAAAAAVVLAAISGVVTYERATAPPETVRLALLPFEAGPEATALSQNLLRDTATQLARIKGNAHTRFLFVPQSKREAATHVLHGSLSQENGKLRLHAQLTDARSSVDAKKWDVVYAPGEARFAPVALAGMVTGTLRLPPLMTNATVNDAARQDYWNGMYYLRRNSTLDRAIPLMERAVSADPASPLTYAGLAEAQWYEYRLTRDHAWLERVRDSLRQAESHNPDLASVHRIEGYLSYAAGSYEQAVDEYQRAIELEPNNGTTYIWLGKAYEDNNHFDKALTSFQKAVEVEPTYFRTYQDLGAFYLQRSNFSEAAKCLRRAVELAPDEANLHWGLATIYMDLGSFPQAEDELRHSIGLEESVSALHTLGLALMYQSKDQEAIPYFRRALALNSPSGGTRKYLPLMYLGIAYRRLHQLFAAAEVNKRGVEMAQAEIARNPRDGYVLAFLGYFDAALGDRRHAEAEISEALGLSSDDSDTRWRAVLTYETLGLRERTLALLSTATAEQLADVSRWPDLAELHKESRFLQLLASHQIGFR